MHGASDGFNGVADNLAQVVTHGIGQGGVRHDAIFEERARAGMDGVVDDLIRRDDMPRRIIFAQGADSVDGDYETDAQGLQGVNVGAVGQG